MYNGNQNNEFQNQTPSEEQRLTPQYVEQANTQTEQPRPMPQFTQQQVEKSYFDGKMSQWLGWKILGGLITSITFGICAPWAICMIYRWEIEHTVVNGKRLKFTGKGGSLLGKWIKWILLSIITIGIYSLWIPTKLNKWKAEHMSF